METIVKQAREVGTSAGVLLPRGWLNKQVVVTLFEPSKEKIAQDILACLFKQDLNEEIKGIYLFGSYARGDFDFNSDIDVLVITEKTNKLVNYNNYEILLVSESSFLKNLPNNLNRLSILKEIKVIFNKGLIEKYKHKKYKFNTIFFSHTDQTPWAEKFLKQIIRNNKWHIVYLDDFTVILTKDKNVKPIIKTDYSDIKSLIRLAHFFQNTNFADQEIIIYQKILNLNPTFCPALYGLALKLQSRNDPSFAIFLNKFQNNQNANYCD